MSHLVEEQQLPVLSKCGVQVVLGLGPEVLAAVEVEQIDSGGDLTLLQRLQAGGGELSAGKQREHTPVWIV